ncbi:hypothetical protein PCANB_001741 [Pneumocystis canis]|nr:hypothetical protein PCK1_002049 [Pneumocystis canis]KAG5440172.1 hypothetical protein PCANB_001741 [Pneumocystis canis]
MNKSNDLKEFRCLKSKEIKEKELFCRIYSNSERRTLETIDVFIGQINTQQVTLIIEFIQKWLPFEPLDLSYLKRIRKVKKNKDIILEIILHSTINLKLEDLKKKLKEHSIDINIQIIQVSKYIPLTLEQFHAWNVLWPLHFRTNIEKQIKFTDESLLKLKMLMNYTWDLANKNKEIKIAALIVNLNLDMIVECVDSRLSSKNPLQHAIINCITQVSQKSKSPEKDMVYLCKDLIVITTHEPCVMCCMALVHSRVFRLFYSINMPKTGGLESNYHIHGRNELNHRYQAFGEFIVENIHHTINEYIHA